MALLILIRIFLSLLFSFPRVPATKVGESFEAGTIPAFALDRSSFTS